MSPDPQQKQDRPLRFAAEKKRVEEPRPESEYRYKIIIADDEKDVHTVTRLVLKDFRFENSGIEFIDTYSGAETIQVLREDRDIAVVLLDVVMENDSAGLDVVEYTRNELQNSLTRIILKTGQPGAAPEERVIIEYDINDYKSKSELTARKFITTIYTALRNFRDLKKLENHKKGLEKVIESSSDFYRYDNLKDFFNGLLGQLNTLRNFDGGAFMAATPAMEEENGFIAFSQEKDFRIIAGTGRYESRIDQPLESIPHNIEEEKFLKEREKKPFFFNNNHNHFVGYYRGYHGSENLIYLEGRLRDLNENLVRIFLTNFTFAFDRLFINRQMMGAMKQIILMLGETIEYRDGETGFHVRRVSEMIRFLSRQSGKPEAYCEELGIASIVHDMGKVAIEDSILKKPGKLTKEEFERIKEHTTIGHAILNNSTVPTIRLAAEIALGHHEKWNGRGYPHGLKGEEIPWSARLTSIVDVYDALANKRYYKDAWQEKEIREYLKEERGESFDPEIADLFLASMDAMKDIQHQYPDAEGARSS